MKYVLLNLIWVLVIVDAKRSGPCANLAIVDGKYYINQLLVSARGFPARLSIDWRTGNVFFVYYVESTPLSKKLFVIRNGECSMREIKDVAGSGVSTTVDQRNGIVYLLSETAIYVYNDKGISAELFASNITNFNHLAVGDNGTNIYLVKKDNFKVYKLTIGEERFDEFNLIAKGEDLTIDAENNFYFKADGGSFIIKSGTCKIKPIKVLPKNRVIAFFVDKHDNAWAVAKNGGLYEIDKAYGYSGVIGYLGYSSVTTFGFDCEDNVLIGLPGGITKFHRKETNPCA